MLRLPSLLLPSLQLSTFLPHFPDAAFALTHFSIVLPLSHDRYYWDSDSCLRSLRRQVSPLATYHFPIVPSSITLYAASSLYPPLQRAALIPGFATGTRARRHTPPNQVRHPTDRQFASSYSPPRLATTQLLSATELWQTPTGTSTLQVVRPHGRTSPGRAGGLPNLIMFSRQRRTMCRQIVGAARCSLRILAVHNNWCFPVGSRPHHRRTPCPLPNPWRVLPGLTG